MPFSHRTNKSISLCSINASLDDPNDCGDDDQTSSDIDDQALAIAMKGDSSNGINNMITSMYAAAATANKDLKTKSNTAPKESESSSESNKRKFQGATATTTNAKSLRLESGAEKLDLLIKQQQHRKSLNKKANPGKVRKRTR